MATQPICGGLLSLHGRLHHPVGRPGRELSRVIVQLVEDAARVRRPGPGRHRAKIGCDPEEAIRRLSPAGGIYFRLDESDVQRILKHDKVMIGSDGLPHDARRIRGCGEVFPRSGPLWPAARLFPLEMAVYKMTGLTAKNFGLKDRGVLKEGAYADLALFDADTVDEAATYENPIAPARGIEAVIVNGTIVWQHGRSTGSRPAGCLPRMQEAGR